ncbi:hypothetical protein DIPPA_06783 [Diplonema papillatum]|nr:hypothetical protein DIPPA_06783 [Diplonema papillatum]
MVSGSTAKVLALMSVLLVAATYFPPQSPSPGRCVAVPCVQQNSGKLPSPESSPPNSPCVCEAVPCVQPAGVPNLVRSSEVRKEVCAFTFVGYRSSPWEQKWLDNVGTWQGADGRGLLTDFWKLPGGGCDAMKLDAGKVDRFEAEYTAYLSGPAFVASPDIFSTHTYEDNCTKRQVTIPIEPLVSFLRHPRSMCWDEHTDPLIRVKECFAQLATCPMMSKDFIVLPWKRDMPSPRSRLIAPGLEYPLPVPTKLMLFDMGASVYNDGIGGASQSWFVSRFEHLGWDFDRILAWEAQSVAHPTFWDGVPADVKSILSYFNIPVSASETSGDNPWTHIRRLCQPEDYCVVKIDIDAPSLEEELVRLLRVDSTLHKIVDELIWEHHVLRNPLSHIGWFMSNETVSTVETSYKWFHELRSVGIRAHSWV